MTKQRHSLDGFVPRRQGAALGGVPRPEERGRGLGPTPPTLRELKTAAATASASTAASGGIRRSDIDESLRGIDQPATEGAGRRARQTPEQRARRRKLIKRVLLAVLVVFLALGAYLGVKAIIAGSNVFKGNPLAIFQNQPLKTDANGRSNIIVFGTAEDDEGGTHEGGNLTDSLMVVSVDQKTKDAYMLSIPRDLWVKYDQVCPAGYQGKINAVYSCASNDGENEEEGAAALRQKIGEVTGLDIQYYVHLNFTAVVEAVDAVGGVDVTIESNPRGVGILDRNFDWKCNYKCHYVKYKDGEKVHLDGEHALALSRARNASGGYGLAAGNFDREKNQQKIIKALQKKATSVGTLTNIGAVTGLIDAMGNNLRTNFATGEIRTLADLGNGIKPDSIKSLSLVDEEAPLVTTGMVSGQSVVRPVAGLMDYSDIQSYLKENLTNDPIAKEKASIVVLNGSGVAGAGQREADKLEAQGFTISTIDNAPEGSYGKMTIYKLGEGSTATATKLKELYGVEFKTTTPPVVVDEATKFVVIVGSAASN